MEEFTDGIKESLEQIDKILTTALDSSTNKIKRDNFKPLIDKLKKIADKIENQENHIKEYNNLINKYPRRTKENKDGMTYKTIITQVFNDSKGKINIKREEKDLLEYIIQGYEVFNKVRTKLTKEKIDYWIGIGSEVNEKNFIQASLSFQELLPMLFLERIGDRYAVRINVTKEKMVQTIKKRNEEREDAIEEILEKVNGASTLYSAVHRYYTDASLKQTKGSWGTAYEVYRRLLAKSKEGNLWKPDTSIISEAFKEVLSGGGRGGSFAVGGDTLNQQNKGSFGGSNPSLTRSTVVVNVLRNLAESLQQYCNSKSTQALQNMLIRKQGSQKVFTSAYNKAVRQLKRALK